MIHSLPGPNAINISLTSSGFPSNRYYFGGYLSKNMKEKYDFLKELREKEMTCVLFENKHRLLKTLQALENIYGPKQMIYIGVEITKLHERHLRGSIEKVYEVLNKNPNYSLPSLKGEITIVVAPYTSYFNSILEPSSSAL